MKTLSTAQKRRMFGYPSYTSLGRSAVRLDPHWVRRNITTVYIPSLDGIPTYGGVFSGRVRFHRRAAEQLQRAFADIHAAKLTHIIKTWCGSFVQRRIRGSRRLSSHALGIAFDINAEWNRYHRRPAGPGVYGTVAPLVPILENHGFAWGGHWSRPDGMHFEVAVLVDGPSAETDDGSPRLVIDGKPVPAAIRIRDGVSYCSLGTLVAAIGGTTIDPRAVVPVAQILKGAGYHVRWRGNDGPRGTIYARSERRTRGGRHG